MGHMSYCRMENTFNDLSDCYGALRDDGVEELSNSEKKYAERLFELCKEFVEEFEDDFEEDDSFSD